MLGSEFDNVKDIVSLSLSNRMNQASGNFQISLTARPVSHKQTYADIITPLDMVEIQLGNTQTVMIGIVDGVTENTSVSKGGVNRRITVAGRSLGAVFTFDNVRYWRGIDYDDLPEDLQQRTNVILKAEEVEGFWGRDAVDAIKAIVKIFTTIEQDYNKNTEDDTAPTFALYDRINTDDELVTMANRKIYNSGLWSFEGTIWQYMKKCVAAPFEELWTDSREGKCYLRMRPTPFDMEDIELSNGSTGGWDRATTWLHEQPYHDITPTDITGLNLSKSHVEAASFFDIIPSHIPLLSSYLKDAAFPPLINTDLVHALGSRGLTFPVNLLPLTEDRDLTEEQHGESFLHWFTQTRMKAYLWYKDNHRYKTGSATVKGNSDYRVGDRIRLTERNGIQTTFYLEGVRHSFQWGSPFTTTLSLTRGATEDDRRKWWDAGKEWAVNQKVAKAAKKIITTYLENIPQDVVDAINTVHDAFSAIEWTDTDGDTHSLESWGTDSAKILSAATASAESGGFTATSQILPAGSELPEGKTGYSYWQVLPFSAMDNYLNFLMYDGAMRAEIRRVIDEVSGVNPWWLSLTKDNKDAKVPIVKELLLNNINFACSMAIVQYARFGSGRIPEIDDQSIDVKDAIARYWGDHYNRVPNEDKIANFKTYFDIYFKELTLG